MSVFFIRISSLTNRLLKAPWKVGAYIARDDEIYIGPPGGPSLVAVPEIRYATPYSTWLQAKQELKTLAEGRFVGVEFEIQEFVSK